MKLFGRTARDTPVPRRRLSDEVVRERSVESETVYRFQRNRTLTGSTSAQLSVAADHSDMSLVTPRQQTHQLRRKRRHLSLILLGLLAASAGIWILMNEYIADPTVRLRALPTVSDTRSYRDTINAYLGANPLERLMPLVKHDRLLGYIQADHPEIKALTITSGTFAQPTIELTARTPVASWAVSGHDKYVDDLGVAFGVNYFNTPDIQVVDQSGIRADSVGVLASNRFLGFIGKTVGYSRTMQQPLAKIVIPAGTSHQIEGYVEGLDYPIKFSIDRPAGEQVEDMVRSISYLKSRAITPEYIDVRVDRRAFYR